MLKKFHSIFSLLLFSLTANTGFSQISTALYSEGRPCVEDSAVLFMYIDYYNFSSVVFSTGDTVTVNIDYGDGQSETKNIVIGPEDHSNFFEDVIFFRHKYMNIGFYTVSATVTCNAVTSTAVAYNQILYSGCESLSGHAYVDFNNNCIQESNDVEYRGKLEVSGAGAFVRIQPNSDASYQVYLPTNNTFTIQPWTIGNPNVVCPSTGAIFIDGVTLPLANQDFSIRSSIQLLVYDSVVYTCSLDSVCWYVQADAIGYDQIDLNLNYGDGIIDTLTVASNLNSGFYGYFCHTYTTPGTYSLKVIASGDYNVDSAFSTNPVLFSDSCGDITGTIFADLNSNCTFEGADVLLSGVYVVLKESGTIIQYDFTDVNGIYSFEDVPVVGNYTVEVLNTGGYLPVSCPNTTGIQTVPSVPASGLDFAFDASNLSGFDLASILNIGSGFNRPGQSRYLQVCTRNFGFTSTTGTLELELDPLLEVTSFNNPQPISVSGNIITWDFTNLIASNPYSSYDPNGMVCFSMYVLTDTTANIGDTLCLTLTSNPTVGDANPINNVLTLCAPVLNSYDPNDKSVSPSGNTAFGFVENNQTMTYTVRFQNTGNAPAFNVFILDTIDVNLDLSTLQPIASSHAMDVQVYDRRVKFMFADINLADSVSNEPASHGFVVYRIAQKANLQPGDVFENTAHIFFDYNPAIVTNTVVNTIESIITSTSTNKGLFGSWNVFPNPASSDITLTFENDAFRTIQIKDVLGKVVRNVSSTSNQEALNISDLNSGVYSVTVSENGMHSTQKVVVRK